MATKWKVILGVLAIIVIAVIVAQFSGRGGKESVPLPGEQPQASEEQTTVAKPPAATGKINDVIDSLLSDSLDEVSQASKAMDDDAALMDFDSQAINDFGQAYNENDF
jgi:hypothetical protein